MIKKPTQSHRKTVAANLVDTQFSTKVDGEKSFMDHISELKRRILWSVVAMLGFSLVAYLFNEQLMAIIQRPFGKTLYFTSPVGGLNFLIKLCITFAVVAALPFFLYQIAKFFAPILESVHKRALVPYLIFSIVLAYGGVAFAYYISLPNALHFLTSFSNENISALITANEYYDFVLAYLLGFAILFQIPLVVLFVNRIKPLTPGGMMRAQRYIILVSFVVAAILTPTPDPVNQTIMAMPAVLLYQISIFLVWRTNKNRAFVTEVFFEDIPEEVVQEAFIPVELPVVAIEPEAPRPVRELAPRRVVNEFLSRPLPKRQLPVRRVPSQQMGQFMDVIGVRAVA